jgi:hypothetical protein
MRVAHEEIFGPVLPIFPYRDVEEAIAYVNARPRPLALYYFGADDEDRRKVLTERSPATSPSTARSCTSPRMTCLSAASGPAVWAHTRLPYPQPCQGDL